MVVKFLAARSLTFICIRPVLSVLFHSFSFCSFMLYNRHGRRQTFAMYAKFSAWMNDYFHNFKGFSLRISFLGSGPDGSVFYYQLFTSNFYFFKHLKILHFFLPPSSIISTDSLPLPPRPSIVKHTLCNGVQPDRGSHRLDISDFCWISQAYAKQNLWFLKCKISE